MRIGINASFLRKPGTGIGQVTLHFLKTLAKLPEAQNHEFFLYLDESVGTCDWPVSFHQKVFLPFRKRDDVPRKLLWERKLARVARADGCEAFVSLYQSATVFPKKFRHLMVVHDIIPFLFPEYLFRMSVKIHAWAMKRGIKKAASLIAVSQWTKNDLIKFGADANKILVVYPSVAPRFREAISQEMCRSVLQKYGLEKGYIYHGGGLEIRKNTKAVLEAYAALVDQKEEGKFEYLPPLVISGKVPVGHPLATDVEGIIKKLNLKPHVKLLGYIPEEDLPALYKESKMFVYPSLYEGFGLPVLEAMTVGVPVITSRTSSLPEVGSDGVLYVDPQNTSTIAEAMKKLLDDAVLREECISKSRKLALQFDWQVFTKTLLSSALHL